MKTKMSFFIFTFLLASLLNLPLSFSKTVEVQMFNKGPSGEAMVFSPEVVFIDVGDSVFFKTVNKGHNVMGMNEPGATPSGSAPWESKFSQDHTQKFTQEGIHGVKCKPHYVMGMIGAVVVGKPVNRFEFEKVILKGKAKERFARILKKIPK